MSERRAVPGTDADEVLVVAGVRYYHTRRGVIASGYDADGRLIVIRAPGIKHAVRRRPNRGDCLHVTGKWEVSPRQEPQINADACEFLAPAHGKLLVRQLRYICDGIGRERADHLFRHFDARGEDLVELLDGGRHERLAEVVPREIARRLAAIWHDRMAETRLVIELDRLGFNPRLAGVLIGLWGDLAQSVVRLNPYLLLAFLSWATVDRIALRLGIGRKDRRRLVGAVEAVLYTRLDRKHTLIRHGWLRRGVQHLLGPGCGPETAEKAIALALHMESAMGDRESGYQTRVVAHMETYLLRRLQEMRPAERRARTRPDGPTDAPQTNVWDRLFERYGKLSDLTQTGADLLSEVYREFPQDAGYDLRREQRRALAMVVEGEISCLSGRAGTGKTMALRALHLFARKAGFRICQVALTEHAAERLQDDTRAPAETVAAFARRVDAGLLRLDDETLVVIDDAHLLGLSAFYTVMRRLPRGTRLLLVGDPFRLPPADFGLAFHRLAESQQVPRTQFEPRIAVSDNGIAWLAGKIRDGAVPTIEPYAGLKDGVSFLDCQPWQMEDRLLEIRQALGGPGEAQIISPARKGTAGAWSINARILKRRGALPGILHEPYAAGDPVLWLENDAVAGLPAGALGVVVEQLDVKTDPGLRCRFGGTERVVRQDEFHKIALAYAITADQAPGAKFPRIIFPVRKTPLLDCCLIYSVMARAARQVVLVGDRELFEQAVRTPAISLRRDTRFHL